LNKRDNRPCRITSYINNLHPQEEKPLYHLISQLITASIPLWELTLAPLIQDNDFARELRINYTECVYDPDPEEWPETEGPQQESDEGDEDFGERRQKWIQDTRVVIRPEPQPFLPLRSAPKLDLRKVYGKRGLQVIVKLANIELTPDKPEYEGGSWHVEGQMVSFSFVHGKPCLIYLSRPRMNILSRPLCITTHATILRRPLCRLGNNWTPSPMTGTCSIYKISSIG
jgi:Protein of unknown function (DUF4246)